MHSRTLLPVLLSLGTTALSQQTSSSYLDITFLSAQGRCPDQQHSTSAPTVSIYSLPAGIVCLNLATFASPNVTYAQSGGRCHRSSGCGLNYTLSGVEAFDASATYERIFYRQSANSSSSSSSSDDDDAVGRLELQAYNGQNCLQPTGQGAAARMPFQWNCVQEEGRCGEVLPYGIGSFSVRPTDGMDRNGTCTDGKKIGGTAGTAGDDSGMNGEDDDTSDAPGGSVIRTGAVVLGLAGVMAAML